MTTTIIDKGWNALVDRVSNGVFTKVGYPTEVGEHDETGLEIVQLAAIHEFGTRDIPMRSHVRSTYDEHINDLEKYASIEFGRVVDGTQTALQGIKRLGERHTAQIKKRIKDGPFEPLAPETIARKKSDKPLIDTGQMLQSVQHVEDKDELV
jgi:hypothetical protein